MIATSLVSRLGSPAGVSGSPPARIVSHGRAKLERAGALVRGARGFAGTKKWRRCYTI